MPRKPNPLGDPTIPPVLFLSCEHGGHLVPTDYRSLFQGAADVLTSHRGWDPGSLSVAKSLERRLAAPLMALTVTRLLVEVNRSPGHRRLFSEFTRTLDDETKQEILQEYYFPYRNRVQTWISRRVEQGCSVVHVSSHSFTPQWNGRTRTADIGLLYDPRRQPEKQFCRQWIEALRHVSSELRVRCNYPYLGKADGLTTHLRRHFPPRRYLGIELEVNQALVNRSSTFRRIQHDLAESLAATLSRRES